MFKAEIIRRGDGFDEQTKYFIEARAADYGHHLQPRASDRKRSDGKSA